MQWIVSQIACGLENLWKPFHGQSKRWGRVLGREHSFPLCSFEQPHLPQRGALVQGRAGRPFSFSRKIRHFKNCSPRYDISTRPNTVYLWVQSPGYIFIAHEVLAAPRLGHGGTTSELMDVQAETIFRACMALGAEKAPNLLRTIRSWLTKGLPLDE